MRDDLGVRDEERGQPRHLPVGRRLAAALALALLAGCGGEGERPLVLASGRDDHGLLVQRTVDVHGEPDGEVLRRVETGTLLAVVGSRGEWLHVRALEGTGADGWVNDYHLRGVAHLVAPRPGCPVRTRRGTTLRPNEQVELLDYERRDDGAWVRVRTVEGGREAWVARAAVGDAPFRGQPPDCS